MNKKLISEDPFPLIPYEYMSPEMRDLHHEYWDEIDEADIEKYIDEGEFKDLV